MELILDLRFNPGGLLTAAVEVSDMFIESGKIVSTEGRNSEPQDHVRQALRDLQRLPDGRADQPLQCIGE